MLVIHLPEDVERGLDELAPATERSPSFHAERAITEDLGDVEDHEAAGREVAEVHAGRSVPVSIDGMSMAVEVPDRDDGREIEHPGSRSRS